MKSLKAYFSGKNDGTGEAAKPKASANTNQAPVPGDKMPDGTIFAGISPDTNKPMYVTPRDAPLTMTFNKAQKYAARLDAHGHKDWRVPTRDELNVLFNNRAAIGGFDVRSDLFRNVGWYLSSSEFSTWDAWMQRFCDGSQYIITKDSRSSVRLVR